jgi:DNA-binding NarL/FixJ family response regulator
MKVPFLRNPLSASCAITPAPISVLVVDGQRLFADAVARRLEAEDDLMVVATLLSAQSARLAMAGRDVHVLLVDADLPDGAALSLCADISRQEHPPLVIMLSASAEAERIVAAIHVGVVGWVRKAETMQYLLRVIDGVTHGETWVPPSELGRVFQLLLHEQKNLHDDELLAPLTARERQVLCHMAEGAGRQQIAELLNLSPHTVRSHMQSLMRKLGAHSALEAVALTGSAACTAL